MFCCFTSQVNSYGHGGTVSSPNHTFSWASLNKQLTSTYVLSIHTPLCSHYIGMPTLHIYPIQNSGNDFFSCSENTNRYVVIVVACLKLFPIIDFFSCSVYISHCEVNVWGCRQTMTNIVGRGCNFFSCSVTFMPDGCDFLDGSVSTDHCVGSD